MKNYRLLATAILRQAAKDYETALKGNNEQRIAYFEKWFMGDWAQLLSGDMGEVIIKVCKKRINGGNDND